MSNPNFIIAGERRSGSTTMYEILKQHSEVGMYHLSDYDFFIEPELFSRTPLLDENLKNWDETHPLSDYQDLFSGLSGCTGQKDADLLWWRPSHERLARMLPDTKFIIILRNPVKRAESQYFNELGKGRETLSFEAAIEREKNEDLSSWQKLHLQYKERGCYASSLGHFYKYISRERVKVVILEELFMNWNEVMTEVCIFLSINSEEGIAIKPLHSNREELWQRNEFSKRKGISWIFNLWDRISEAIIVRITNNTKKRVALRRSFRGWYYRSARAEHKVNPSIIDKLKQFYKPHNEDLEKLLGKKLSYWQ
ncbi:MAG: sulfotransferase [Bacteroidia bacterium]|nr:sulfotransferase [Bacteroidia bacterium]MBT8276144.1 sulfotransferase [Bacteroidia bacterium]NNF32446.1 hypothetical protein [Flavobacteriaceae bacterium]NNJ81713.1 hypothetical protein [Flavobacteriaceae bacterium]NNM08987.1 hypothetical protein [Flavobacteriaceae bacterium]